MKQTLGGALSRRDNALNFVRLTLATAVVLGHAWTLGGFEESAVAGLRDWAVNGFFAISGYLIAGSRMRLNLGPYLWRRALRILPAFYVCLIVTAFVIAPLSTLISGEHYDFASGVGYVVRNAGLYMVQWGIDDTLLAVPYEQVWNGSLWTLFYEFLAYIAAGLLLVVPFARRHAVVVVAAVFIAVVAFRPLAYGPLDVTTNLYLNSARLGAYFLAGMLIYFLRDRIRVRGWLPLVALALLVGLGLAGWAEWAAQLPLAFLVIWGGRFCRSGSARPTTSPTACTSGRSRCSRSSRLPEWSGWGRGAPPCSRWR